MTPIRFGPNERLLTNTLDSLHAADATLEHVTLFQGMKYYGADLGRFRTPAREDDARLPLPHFHFRQQDVVERLARRTGIRDTVLRPEGAWRRSAGTPMNILMAIAVYVSITRHLGLPLRVPGLLWAGDASSASDGAFNVTNGDVYRWRQMWEAISDNYRIRLAEPQEIPLTSTMASHRDTWSDIVDAYDLRRTDWDQLVDWRFTDVIFGSSFDGINSTIKIRHAGFTDCVESTARVLELLDALAADHIHPAA